MGATPSSGARQLTVHCGTPANSRRRVPQGFWPDEAKSLVKTYLELLRRQRGGEDGRAQAKALITQLVTLTGYSREKCWRFARRMGINGKQSYRGWSVADQQRLLDLISKNPACEVAQIMRRSLSSIRGMLSRLGASAKMGHDWFTVYTLAEALHTRGSVIQTWIDRGWLKTRTVETGKLQRQVIEADAFAEFCKEHGKAVVGHRLRADRLEFVKNFVFPPSHSELLPVRESKKERAAFESLTNTSDEDPENSTAAESTCPASD